MTVWFTSDLHLGHANIIKYSERPFASIQEHDELLVKAWNDRVRPGDLVYCLGDFALCDVERATRLASRLSGQKYMVWGNHDKYSRKSAEFCAQWIWARDLADITVGSQRIVLCHFAMRTWNQSHRGAWNLHGHSHGSLPDDPHALQLDVGVDCWGYAPVSFDTLAARMTKKNYQPVDHHGRAD